jgi:molybdenum cofactor biosynthesis enzyme MoaA
LEQSDRKLFILVAIARTLNLHLTTNGSTFHVRLEHIQKLVSSGIPKVTISLRTPDPDTFIIRGHPLEQFELV